MPKWNSNSKDVGLHCVIALDPGGTTGVAKVLIDDAGRWIEWECLQVASGKGDHEQEARSSLRLAQWMTDRIGLYDSLHFVVEDFVQRMRVGTTDKVGLAPVRVTALVEGVLLGAGIDPVWDARQSAADAKNFGTRQRLADSGAWKATVGKQHARDAARHALLYVERHLK